MLCSISEQLERKGRQVGQWLLAFELVAAMVGGRASEQWLWLYCHSGLLNPPPRTSLHGMPLSLTEHMGSPTLTCAGTGRLSGLYCI